MSATQCQALVDQLSNFAPLLQPRICPKGYEDNCLFTLCKTSDQKDQLTKSLSKLNDEIKSCTVCNNQTNKGT